MRRQMVMLAVSLAAETMIDPNGIMNPGKTGF